MKRLLALAGSDPGRRLRRIFSAQMLNQIVTVAVQLGLVPVLLVAWGKPLYGTWLLLSAIPSYLTFSDLGFTLIAKNEMLMHTSAGRRDAALGTFHSVFGLLNVVVPCVLLVSAVLLMALDPSRILKLGDYPAGSARVVLALLLVNVLVYQYFLLICGGVRCENRVASEAAWGACSRLSEGLVVAAAALAGGGLMIAAAATLASRLAFSLGLYLWLRRASPWLYLGHRHAHRAEIRRFARPAFAFMLMPVSQALLIQGPVLILGALLGPVVVVTFATTRTLTRLGTAAMNMLNGTLNGEYGVAYGRGDGARVQRIFRYHQWGSLALILVYGLALYGLKDVLMGLYTHGRVPAVEPFFTLMILVIAAEMMWSSIATPLESINRHVALAHSLLAICLIGMLLCYGLTLRMGLTGTALALLAIHGTTIAVCYGLRHNLALPGRPVGSVLT